MVSPFHANHAPFPKERSPKIDREQANMGVALGDFNHSGRESIAITHFSEDYAILYRNDGGLNFSDVAHSARIAQIHDAVCGVGRCVFRFE